MTSRRIRPIAKIAVISIVAVAVLAYMISACSWFGGGPPPVQDPYVESGRLVRLTHNDSTETNPVWSPRGDKIAFECISDGRRGIWPFSGYSAPSNNREVKNWPITTYYYPSYICVMNADGSKRKQLTDYDHSDYAPAWSLDGRKIVFSSKRLSLGYSNILVMNADGSDQSLLFDASRLYEDIGRRGEPAYVKAPADLPLLSTLTGMRRIHRITRK